jgi:disulfide bond formation protein DsbB
MHSRIWLLGAWLVALSAMVGSLFFSEILRIPPCELCWYQRIAMYPLVVFYGLSLWNEDWRVASYTWPLVVFGGIVAGWQSLTQFVPSLKEISPCTQGISCSEINWQWGPFTIPVLSFIAFIVIAVCLWLGTRASTESANFD